MNFKDMKQLKKDMRKMSPLTALIGVNALTSKYTKEETKSISYKSSSTCVLVDEMTDELNVIFGAVEDLLMRASTRPVTGRYWSMKTVVLTVPPGTQLQFYSSTLFTKCNLEMNQPFTKFFLIKEDQHKDSFVFHFQVSSALPTSSMKQLANRIADALLPSSMDIEMTPGVKVRHIYNFRESDDGGNTTITPYTMRKQAGFVKENIYLLWTSHTEGEVAETIYSQQVDLLQLLEELQRLYNQNMAKVCLSPTSYDTILAKISMMNSKQLREVFRENDLDQLYQQIQSLIFDKSVYDLCNHKKTESMSDQNHKLQLDSSYESVLTGMAEEATIKKFMVSTEYIRNHVQESSHITNYKLFLRCVLGPTQNKLEHPSFFAHVKKNTAVLLEHGVVDIAIYNTEFIVPLILVARYVARICMQDMDSLSSNGASLLMCGAAGAGKSIIANSIARFANGYKWNADTLYQTPNLMSASVIVIEEAKLAQMSEPLYKQLLDITAYAKVEIKNAHPVDATLHCPVILNTNEQVFDYFQGSTIVNGGRQSSANYNRSRKYFTNEQLAAVHRRVCIVPFTSKFSKLHVVPYRFTSCHSLQRLYSKFSNSPNSEARLFNFFLAFGIYQTELSQFEVNKQLIPLMEKLTTDFNKTIFGQIYFTNRGTIDKSFRELEGFLNADLPDENEILRLTYKLSQYLAALVETEFGILITNCKGVNEDGSREELQDYWSHPDWCEMTSFVKRLMVAEHDEIREQLDLTKVCTDFAEQWRSVLFQRPAYIDEDEEIEDERETEFE